MRARKAAANTIANLIYEMAAMLSGFIVPYLILANFGSDYFGINASITQFIGYTALLAGGVTHATRAALYGPLARHDTGKISAIVRATEVFLRKVALLFLAGLVIFSIVYPFLLRGEYDWFFVFSLALILGISTFARYFFGLANEMLLIADQRSYIVRLIRTGTVLLNVAAVALLIFAGGELRVVMLASAVVFAISPLIIYLHTNKRYQLLRHAQPDTSAIKQRGDALFQEMSNFITHNSAIVILTVLADIREVAVYSVYFLVVRNVETIVKSLMGQDIVSALGNMFAKGEHENIRKNLSLYEFMAFSLSAVFLTCTAVLIVPFVSVYTAGITDADYHRPLFAYIICGALFFSVLRRSYDSIVFAAGHFRQTRNAAIVEIAINVILSVALAFYFGIIGLAIAMLCTKIYRTAHYAVYVSRNLVPRSLWLVVKKLGLFALNVGVIIGISAFLPPMAGQTYMAWIIHAFPVFCIAVGVTFVFAMIFYRQDVDRLVMVLRSIIRKK